MTSLRKRTVIGHFTMVSLFVPLVIVVLTSTIVVQQIIAGLVLMSTSAVYAFLLHQLKQPLNIKFGRNGYIK